MINTTSKLTNRYSIVAIREEAINLIYIGAITLDQPLQILLEYLPAGQGNLIERELERYDYLLRDHIIDLVGKMSWESD